jgi:hypothetical protein
MKQPMQHINLIPSLTWFLISMVLGVQGIVDSLNKLELNALYVLQSS